MLRRTQLIVAACSGLLASLATLRAAAEPAPFMMRAQVNGRLLEGQPLAWGSDNVVLLGRDGALYEFNPADARDSRKTATAYAGYAIEEMQALIRTEFDDRFAVSTTAHFVVVHPKSQGADWADRLETLYRGFTHYMSVRGFPIAPPATPLVATVFRSRDEYYAHAAAAGSPLPPGVLGHYELLSNRVYLFDAAADSATADWADVSETVIHEATHQTAYNVGVHARFGEQPRWLVEGLAMMFEARGVWNAASLHSQADRINRYRLDFFRSAAEHRPENWIALLVASDQAFQYTALDAYAASWALTFYLCETRSQEYSRYLARVAARKAFSKYPPAERLADFTGVFGRDFELLAAQLGRFIDTLP